MSNSPRVALVAPYPLLLGFLREEIRRAFPAFDLSVHDDLAGIRGELELVIYFQVRGHGLDLDALAVPGRRSHWDCSVLVLSETPRLQPQPLPVGMLLRDMAISLTGLLRLLGQLAQNRRVPDLVEPGTPFRRFTPREWRVLEYLRHGASNKEIAYRMRVSESTIKFHMGKLFAKIGCENRIQMALLAGELVDQRSRAIREGEAPSELGRGRAANDQPG